MRFIRLQFRAWAKTHLAVCQESAFDAGWGSQMWCERLLGHYGKHYYWSRNERKVKW